MIQAGNVVDDLPDVSFRRFLMADGHYWTELEYPADRGYRVVMTGTGAGPARVFSTVMELASAGVVYQYDFTVETGGVYQSETAAPGSPLVSAQSRIEPVIAVADSAWIEARPGLDEPPRWGSEATGAAPQPAANAPNSLFAPNNIKLIAAFASCLGALVMVLVALGLFWYTRRGRQPQRQVGAPQRAPTFDDSETMVSPYAAMPGRGRRLVVVVGQDRGRIFPLAELCRIGRSTDNDIVLDDSQASRWHARLESRGASCTITDLGSGNGTLVNGQAIIAPTFLTSGDIITIGGTQFKVE